MLDERLAQISPVEEARVLKPGPQHGFVAGFYKVGGHRPVGNG